jgi:hypothetical protein
MTTSNAVRDIALLVSFVLLHTVAIAADKEEVKEFGGDFQTGMYFKCGDAYRMVPMFMDLNKPAVIKSADDKISDNLLKDICKNGDDLKIVPAVARQLDKQQGFQGNRYADALHIAVFPHSTIKVGKELKGTAYFEPGPLTKVDEVVKKYGRPLEKEAWIAKEFLAWIGLNGTVQWWGAVGIAGSSDGTITHVLIREKEGVYDSKQ